MAYGINAPFGLQARTGLLGYTYSGKNGSYLVASGYSTSLFRGDRVARNLADGTIVLATPGTQAIGTFVGVQYIDSFGVQQFLPYWAASTVTQNALPALALVNDDYTTLFDVQVSNSTNTTTLSNYSVVTSQLGQNANLAIGGGGVLTPTNQNNPTSGSTITGNSGYYLDFSTISTDTTLDVKIIGFTPVPGNVSGLPFNNVLVLLNNDTYRGNGTGFTNDTGKFTGPITGAYTATMADEIILVDTTGGGITVTLPAAAASNRTKEFVIKNVAAANNVTVQTVDAGGTVAPHASARFVSNGTTWYNIA